MQPFLFLFCVCTPRGKSWSQAVLAETVETGDKIGGMTKAIHGKLSQEILMRQDFSTCGGWRGY